MVKIDGIDPMVVDFIKDKTQKKIVIETEKIKITGDKNEEEKERRYKRAFKNIKELKAIVESLNDQFKKRNAPVRLGIINTPSGFSIQVMDIKRDQVISVIGPEKLLELIKNMNKPGGVMVDRTI